jgi:hypothetical protein
MSMTRDLLILELCREAGDEDREPRLVDGWTRNHAMCCDGTRIRQASQGDVAALIQVRLCMGLPLTR